MSRKMQVNRLDKDELLYEMAIRGIGPGTCEEMRHRLSIALQMEKSGDSLRYPKYPFTFKQDVEAVQGKIAELVDLIDKFDGNGKSSQCIKMQTKLAHVLGRIDNVTTDSEEENVERSGLLATVLSLMDKLNSKVVVCETQVVPPNLSVMEGLAARTSEETFQEHIARVPRSSLTEELQPSSSLGIKPILPNKWDLKFSGDKRGLSITAFFERVEELRKARNVSKAILLESGIDLFVGKAYQFYQECRMEVTSWDGLVEKFKQEYLPIDYNEKLFDEIKRRTQGSDETIGTYLAIMSKYFQRLECTISEETKLKILLRNLSPFYQNQLALVDVSSVAHLRSLGRKLEERREAVERYAAPGRHKQLLEPDLAYLVVEEDLSSLRVSPGTSKSTSAKQEIVCFRCNTPGHKAIGCVQPRKLICYRCKKEGYTVKTCPTCSSGNGERRS